MKTLKALVITMAVLIIAGLAVIAVTVFKRATTSDRAPSQVSPNAGRAARPEGPPRSFQAMRVALPKGSRVVTTEAEDGRLILTLELATGETRIIVIDLSTGRRLGTIDLDAGK